MKANDKLDDHLQYLKLHYIQENYKTAASHAAKNKLSHIDFLTELVEQEHAKPNDILFSKVIRHSSLNYSSIYLKSVKSENLVDERIISTETAIVFCPNLFVKFYIIDC